MESIRTASTYYIPPGKFLLIENALGNPDLIQSSVAADCQVTIVDSSNFPLNDLEQWPVFELRAADILLKLGTGMYYIYLRVPANDNSTVSYVAVTYFTERLDRDGYVILENGTKGEKKGEEGYKYYVAGTVSARGGNPDAATNPPSQGRVIEMDLGKTPPVVTLPGNLNDLEKIFQVDKVDPSNANSWLLSILSVVKSMTVRVLNIGQKLIFGTGESAKELTDVAVAEDAESENKVDDSIIATTGWTETKLKALSDEYLSKKKEDRTPYKLSSDTAFEVGKYTPNTSGAIVYEDKETGRTKGELDELFARLGLNTNNVQSKNYSSGALGEGFLIKVDSKTGKSYMEVDELFVRIKAMFSALEIKQLSYAGGNYMFTDAGMKCAKVEEYDDYWRCYLLVDDGETAVENPFREGDQVRFQEYNIKPGVYENISNRYYWRLCVGIGDDYIDLSKTDCDANSDAPQEGDSLVQLGNRTDEKRQNAILLSVYGDDAPSIHQYAGIDSYSLAGKDVTVISPNGNKFTGDFILKTGVDVLTQFGVLENLIYSEISSVRDEIQAKDNYLYNSSFMYSTDGWETSNNIRLFSINGNLLLVNNEFYSRKNAMAAIIRYGNRNVLRIFSSGIKQANADLSNKPVYAEGEQAGKFYISFFYKVFTAGTLSIGFQGQDLYFTERLEPNEEYAMKEYSGTWDGTGDFELRFTGDIYLHSLALTNNAYEDMITKFETALKQTNESIEAIAERTTNLEDKSAGWLTTADGVKIWAAAEFNDKGGEGNTKVSSLFNVTADSITLKSEHIKLEGIITADGNIKIKKDGSIECKNGSFTGTISSENGKIGAFEITERGLSNISDNPKACIYIEKDGGRFFRVNESDALPMCQIRGDKTTALGISAFGDNSVGLDAFAQAGRNSYAIKSQGDVYMKTRDGETVELERLKASGLSVRIKRIDPTLILTPNYVVQQTDGFIVYSGDSFSYEPVLILPDTTYTGQMVYVKNKTNINIPVKGNICSSNGRTIVTQYALGNQSMFFVFDGDVWVHFSCV